MDGVVETDARRTSDVLRGAAAVACVACRRLKMRCIGAANPPCDRCVRNSRECIIRLPNRQQQHRIASRTTASARRRSSIPQRQATARSDARHSQEPTSLSPSKSQSSSPNAEALPSIFSSSPINIAATQTRHAQSSETPTGKNLIGSHEVSYSIVRDLVEFFIQTLLCYTPSLSIEPLDDIDFLITTRRPLAHAMAFIASIYSLGYGSTHQALFPQMAKLLEQSHSVSSSKQDEAWTLLQALGVLYAFPSVAAVSGQTGAQCISIWAVKSAVEACAMQMSLHDSVEALNDLVESRQADVSASIQYRYAFYWLWLFVKSRHHSIVTRTPPTIHNDSTVVSTMALLELLDPQPAVWRVLAEAALNHVWDRAASPDKSLAEWWCRHPSTMDSGSLLKLLDNAEHMLQDWSMKWLQNNDMVNPNPAESSLLNPPAFANFITAFMGTMTRFSIASYAIPIVGQHFAARTGIETSETNRTPAPGHSTFLKCVLKSADAASKCCDTVLNLKPATREPLRYAPDYGFTMMALCCLHLIYAHDVAPDSPTTQGFLSKAEQMANLMVDLGLTSNICPKVYGEYILLQVQKATRSAITPPLGTCDADHITIEPQQTHDPSQNGNETWDPLGVIPSLVYPQFGSLFHLDIVNINDRPLDLDSDILLPPNAELAGLMKTYGDFLGQNGNSL